MTTRSGRPRLKESPVISNHRANNQRNRNTKAPVPRRNVNPHPSSSSSKASSTSRFDFDVARSTNHKSNFPNERSWIYVSGVANHVTCDSLHRYTAGKLNCDDIRSYLLLPRGTDPSSRRLLSFKVDLPSAMVSRVLKASFWPPGVAARHFVPDQDFQAMRQGKTNPLHLNRHHSHAQEQKPRHQRTPSFQ
jgi:hypothetical protein